MNYISLLKKRLINYAKENEVLYVLYGAFSFLGFIIFYFANFHLLIPDQKENFYIRSVAALLSFFLILKDVWPDRIKKYLPVYWYVALTFNLPFFFTFMLLQNNFSLEWQFNELMALTIMAILVDFSALIIFTPIGILAAIFLHYFLSTSTISIPPYEISLVASSVTIMIFVALINVKKNNFYQERLRYLNQIQTLNNSLEQKVAERTAELEVALKAKTEFLNNMSHEVRTPITGVEGISQGLVDNWDKFNDAERLDFAKKVASNATRLRSLVGNLLDLSKFTAGKMILDFKNMNLNESVHSMIDEVQELYLQNKPISFKFNESFKASIVADSERISQVMRNLFVNAVKFSPADKDSTITASLEKTKLGDKDAILFRLSDEGVGVPENELEAIFDPFTQSTKTKTRAGGTGLGLSICKEIIEAHGGKIWAENNKKVGASFSFIIPAQMDENNEHAFGFKPAKPKKEKPTVLFIDDEESCRITMSMILMSSNYNVIKADGGIKGLEILKEKHEEIDIVLVDLMMPDMYGLDVLKAIKAEKKYANIPVILQTGTSEQKELDKAKDLGVDGYIKKPYIKDSVLLEIASKLN